MHKKLEQNNLFNYQSQCMTLISELMAKHYRQQLSENVRRGIARKKALLAEQNNAQTPRCNVK